MNEYIAAYIDFRRRFTVFGNWRLRTAQRVLIKQGWTW